MTWVLLSLAAIAIIVALSQAAVRRVAAFQLYLGKYLVLFLLDWIMWRRFWAYLMNKPYQKLTRPLAARLFCEDMGPTFIKFGQMIGSSAGVVPDRYVEEFQKCLDDVRPFPFHRVVDVLHAELGDERSDRLVSLAHTPLASASIAQVHEAELDDGTAVVVKVQRPNIAERIAADIRVMRFFARLLVKLFRTARHANPSGIVDDLAQTLSEEIDFRKEAENLDRFNEIMAELGHTDIRAPVPHWQFTTERVLVMERFVGIRVDDVEAIRERGVDAEASLVKGLRAWFQCVVFYGFFHGDVHAGNLMFLDNGDDGFLDFGIVGRFDDRQRFLVTDWMIAFATSNYRRLAEVIVEMEGAPKGLDMDAFTQDLADVYGPLLAANFGDVNLAEVMPKIRAVALKHDMRLPREFVLITKQLLYFDRYAKLLAPNLNVFKDPRLVVGMLDDIVKARSGQSAS